MGGGQTCLKKSRHVCGVRHDICSWDLLNPNWHELWKQEKCSSLVPPRGIFYKTQWAWMGMKLTWLISIFTSEKVWFFFINIQLRKSDPKKTRGGKCPPLCQLGLKLISEMRLVWSKGGLISDGILTLVSLPTKVPNLPPEQKIRISLLFQLTTCSNFLLRGVIWHFVFGIGTKVKIPYRSVPYLRFILKYGLSSSMITCTANPFLES